MKKYLTVLAAGIILFACDNKEKEAEYQNQINELEASRQALQEEVEVQKSAFEDFTKAVADIEKNLSKIRAREMNIEMKQQDGEISSEDLRNQLREDIAVIDQLISENKQTIEGLNARLRNADLKNESLNTSMDALTQDLNKQIEEREHNINELKAELDNAQVAIKNLNAEVDSLVSSNTEKTIALNTAYYVSGDFKELKDEQILNKEGGFLGFLGRTEVLVDDFNHEKFNRIDIRETTFFPVEGTDMELVTIHPPGSYKIEKEESGEKVNLVVSDPDKFWESSKYMVMMVK
jgi:predicted  nucleic acid-binding Zn-ribbon protein